MTIAERIEALRPLTLYGPEYNRGVTTALNDAALFYGRDDLVAAEHFVLVAETRAGLHTFEEFMLLDPFSNDRTSA